jgi:hypothetical protein
LANARTDGRIGTVEVLFIVAGVVGVVVVIVAPVAVCVAKGKPFMAIFGVFGTSLWAIVGALRLAKPDSVWARRYYSPEKRQRAEARFLPLGNPGKEPGADGTAPVGATHLCRLCGRYLLGADAAYSHADGYHLEAAFDEAKAAIEALSEPPANHSGAVGPRAPFADTPPSAYNVARPSGADLSPAVTESSPPAQGPAVPAPEIGWKRCPDCAESVRADARICRYCRYEFTAPTRP